MANKQRYSMLQIAKQSGWSTTAIYNRVITGIIPHGDIQMLNARKYSKELFDQIVAELKAERKALNKDKVQ